MDPALLDRLRRGFPLHMDASGRFWFEEVHLEHPRVVAYFRAHIDATPSGEPIICVEGKYVHFTCEDTPFRVTGVTAEGSRLDLKLNDQRVLPLDPADLTEQGTAGILTHVPSQHSGRRLAARFANHAAMELARWVEMEGDATWLRLGTERYPIQSSPVTTPM